MNHKELQNYMENYCWYCNLYKIKENEIEQKGEPYCCQRGIETCLVNENIEKELRTRKDLFSRCKKEGYFILKK